MQKLNPIGDNNNTENLIYFELCHKDGSKIRKYVSNDCWACDPFEIDAMFFADCEGNIIAMPLNILEYECCSDCYISCWKSRFLEIGFDNTGTSFRDTNAVITLEYQDCPSQSFNIPNTNSWTAQTQAFADGFFATQPDLIESGIFCTRPGTNPPVGCANLPTPVVFISGMQWRYAGARACLGTKLPFRIIYNSDQRTNIVLDYAFAETPLIYWDRIVDKITGEEQWRIQGEAECQDERPPCVIPCGEEFPSTPDVLQCDSEVTDGCFCSEEEGIENQNGITRISKVCEGEILQVDYYSNFGEDNQELLESEGFYFDPTCDCAEPPVCLRTYSRCNAETCLKVEFCELSNGEVIGPFIPGTQEPSEVPGPYVECQCPNYDPKVTCFEISESIQEIFGNQESPWLIVPGDIELTRQGGNQQGDGGWQNPFGQVEYSRDGGITFGNWSQVLGGGQQQTGISILIRNTVTGTTVSAVFSSVAGGGSRNFEGVATVVSEKQLFECKTYSDGTRICCDELGNEIELPEEVEQVECPNEFDKLCAIEDILSKRKSPELIKCYDVKSNLIDSDNVIDINGSQPIGNAIKVFPNESGEVNEICIRILNNGTDPQGVAFTLNIDGETYGFDQNSVASGPLGPADGNIPPGRYDVCFIIEPPLNFQAGGEYELTRDEGPIENVFWTVNTESDNSQVEFDPFVSGLFPQLTLCLNQKPLRYTECTYVDESIKLFDELNNEIEELPSTAIQVPCGDRDLLCQIADHQIPIEECCLTAGGVTPAGDRWCQNFEFEFPAGVLNPDATNVIIRVNVGGTFVDLPNTYTEEDLLTALNLIQPDAGWFIEDGSLYRTDGPGAVSIATSFCVQSGLNLSCSRGARLPIQVFLPAEEGECKDYVRTWSKFEEPIGDLLQQIEANTNSLGDNCENAIFTRECPPEPCPPPSEEVYCDSNGTKYVVLGFVNDSCGTSGTFLAEPYYTDGTQTTYEPTGKPQLCDDATIKEQECLIDECGTRWSCVNVITPVAGTVVESQTCVLYVEPADCNSEIVGAEATNVEGTESVDRDGIIATRMLEGRKAVAVKSLTGVKSIKLTVADINAQIDETTPDGDEMPTPVGETCPCPCGGNNFPITQCSDPCFESAIRLTQ